MKRAIILVIDALGIGALPDADQYGDPPGANTLANVASANAGLILLFISLVLYVIHEIHSAL